MKTHPMLALDLFHVLQNPHLRETLRSTREASVPAEDFYETLHDAYAEFLASRLEAPFQMCESVDFRVKDLSWHATYSNRWLYLEFEVDLERFLVSMGLPGDVFEGEELSPDPLSPGEIEMFLDFCSLYLLDYLSENYTYSSEPLDLFKVAKSKKSKSKKSKSKSQGSARLRISL